VFTNAKALTTPDWWMNSHFLKIDAGSSGNFVPNTMGLNGIPAGNYIWITLPCTYTTLSSFTSWLAAQYAAGTPVTILYQLATPITHTINPTRIN
jgi:hypothetical protein